MNRLRKEIHYFIEKINDDYPILYIKSLMYELPKLTKKEQIYLLKKINEFNKSNEEIVNKYLQDIDIYEIELVNLKLEHIEIKERLDILWKYYRYLDLKDIQFYILNMHKLMKYNN